MIAKGRNGKPVLNDRWAQNQIIACIMSVLDVSMSTVYDWSQEQITELNESMYALLAECDDKRMTVGQMEKWALEKTGLNPRAQMKEFL